MGRRKKSTVIRRSGFEDRVEKFLKSKKVKYKYEPFAIKYTVPERIARYTPDFVLDNGVIVECKGLWDAASRKRMALVVAQNPSKDIRMLFMRDNFIRKGSETTYSMWATKNNIPFAIGTIPKNWYE